MFKIKGEDILRKGLISSKRAGDFDVIQNIVKSAFHNLKAEDFKKPFACPALNLEKNKMYVMNRGNLEALLPYCIPYPPLFKPHQKNISAVREVKALADHLRKQGANYIVLINVLGGSAFKTPINDSDSVENLVWAEIASQMVKESSHVDYTITVNLDSYSVLDFENKRDMMQKGSSQGSRAVKDLAEKLGL
jgi:NTE family protein